MTESLPQRQSQPAVPPQTPPPAAEAGELSRPEHDVLAMLAIAHPDGLWEQDLRDILHMHNCPAEAAEQLVKRGLVTRSRGEPPHWVATARGLQLAERI